MDSITQTDTSTVIEPRITFVTIGPDVHQRIRNVLTDMVGKRGFQQIPYGWEIYQGDLGALRIATHEFMIPDGDGMRAGTEDEMREHVRQEISNHVNRPAVVLPGSPDSSGVQMPAVTGAGSPANSEITNSGLRYLLSTDFETLLKNAQVSPQYALADDDEAVAERLGCEQTGDPLFPAVSGYDVVRGDAERPLLILRYRKKPIGFYANFGLYIRPKHSAFGYGGMLIVATAVHLGIGAFIPDERENPRAGSAFSKEEYEAHVQARKRARGMVDRNR